MIAYLATSIVGLIFLGSGTVKALSSGKLLVYLIQYRIFSSRFAQLITFIFIGIECALGAALIVYAFPQQIVPVTAILLILFSAIILWSTFTDRTNNFGFYGGLIVINPIQKILLNLVSLFLLALASYYPAGDRSTATWQGIVILLVLVLGVFVAQLSQSKPLVDFSYLKVGKKWRKSWLRKSHFNLQKGTYFLVFMQAECTNCQQWIPLLNIVSSCLALPNVIGIMTLSREEIIAFKAKHLAHFPIATMNKVLFKCMTDKVPTVVLLKDSKIEIITRGQMPQEYFQKLQQFYQATLNKEKPKQSIRFSSLKRQ